MMLVHIFSLVIVYVKVLLILFTLTFLTYNVHSQCSSIFIGGGTYISEVSVTLTHTDPITGNGTIIIPSGLIQLTSGKIIL